MPHENQTTSDAALDEDYQPFDIHQKLKNHIKVSGESLTYMKLAQPYQDGCNLEFITRIFPDLLFIVYERHGEYFVLVDFFRNYDEACDEAKAIIDKKPKLKASINGRIKH